MKLGADRLGLLCLFGLAFIENPKKEDPRQLGDVLQCSRAVGPPHDVADRLDRSVDGLRRGEALTPFPVPPGLGGMGLLQGCQPCRLLKNGEQLSSAEDAVAAGFRHRTEDRGGP